MIRLTRRRVPACDLLDAFEAATDRERFYWERPESGEALLGIGAAQAFEAAGPDRFAFSARAALDLWLRIPDAASGPSLSRPRLLGGFAFRDQPAPTEAWREFPPARWVLPDELRVQRGHEAWECRAEVSGSDRSEFSPLAAPPTLRSRWPAQGVWAAEIRDAASTLDDYRGRVAAAIAAIRAGELEKIVVARSQWLQTSRPLHATQWLRNLRSRHPSCTIFAVTRGRFTLLGASPERLLSVESGSIRVDVVAGSAPLGDSAREQHAHARRLRESKKEQAEHAIVVRAVRAALARSCTRIEAAEAPALLRTGGIQHLFTPVSASLRAPTASAPLELAGALHPTPAVAGAPTRAALEWISRHEELDRGWYAGPVGWLDSCGSGELSVALRVALVCGSQAILYAGAGIVADSEVHSELRETELKLASVLAARPESSR